MSRSRRSAAPAVAALRGDRVAACASPAQPPVPAGKFGLGKPATPEEIAGWDIDVKPDGTGLPRGRGSVADGQTIYDAKCASCHGTFGESNSYLQIAGGVGIARLRCADSNDRQQAQLRDDALRLHPARDAVQRAAIADRGRGVRADRVRAQPQRHRRPPTPCSTRIRCRS